MVTLAGMNPLENPNEHYNYQQFEAKTVPSQLLNQQ